MLKKLKQKEGELNILLVVLIMVVCYMLSGMVDISSKQWALKETQSKLDIAGMNALYNSIDLNSLKFEKLDIGGNSIAMDGSGADSLNSSTYTKIVKDAYVEELRNVTYGGKRPTIRYTNVDFSYTNTGLGYSGSTAKRRPQVALESVISYTVASSDLTDISGIYNNKSVTSSLSNTKFDISIEDSANDGESILLIHSETKLVLK